jgi:hypothetical protein
MEGNHFGVETMSDKTITLRANLVERLERLAQAQGRTLDEGVRRTAGA